MSGALASASCTMLRLMDLNLSLAELGALLGGLGLFLLAVSMITDGLRLAAGNALRDLLGRWTRTPLRGIGSGMLITAIVQSSSAVTVATIGFVNANLLTMQQALGVVYGANIGTTMTGWLVAAVGFKIKVELFALPMVGAGMVLRLTGAATRRAAIGEALAGFGLFFIGIDVLRGAFEGLAQGIDLAGIGTQTIGGLALFVLAGFFMTLVTQSSSAAIAITLTAATGGVVTLPAAAAMVIGANVGTTSTAVLAIIGATPNAKRVASAHVVFNVATGTVALLLLPMMLWLVDNTGRLLNLEGAPAVALALFHTLFNVLGVVLMWPFTARLAAFLQRRFTSTAELLERPRFIDATTRGTPGVALDAMRLELRRVVELVRRMGAAALEVQVDSRQLGDLHQAVTALITRIDDSVTHIERSRMTHTISQALPAVLRATHQLREAADAALAASRATKLAMPQTASYYTGVAVLLAGWRPEEGTNFEALQPQVDQLTAAYQAARDAVLEVAAEGQLPAPQAHAVLEHLRYISRLVEQLFKAARSIDTRLPAVTELKGDAPADVAPTSAPAATEASS